MLLRVINIDACEHSVVIYQNVSQSGSPSFVTLSIPECAKQKRFGLSNCRISFVLTTALKMWVVSYLIERASGLAQRTIERTKITMDLAQKTIGSTTLYSQ